MKVKKFNLGNGDEVELVESVNQVYIRDAECGCTITSNNHFGYIQTCYSSLISDHDIDNLRPCLIHLGVGFGYDLLYVDNLLQKCGSDYRLVGVDLMDYGDLRVPLERFDCHVEFHSMDVMKYLESVSPPDFKDDLTPDRAVVVLVDLFLKGLSPIDLVYDESLWLAILKHIDPDHVVVNRCGGPDTFPIASRTLGPLDYKKTWSLEFYHRKKND